MLRNLKLGGVMKIAVKQESETLLAGWWARKGERYISSWLTVSDIERKWFEKQMVELYGKNWDKK